MALGTAGLLAVLAWGAASATADVVSYQKGDGKGAVSETDDVTLDETQPNTNLDYPSPSQTPVNSCVVDRTNHQHCLVKFPNIFGSGANQVPPGSTILSATLTMYMSNNGTDCPIVYQATESWTESEATWNNRKSGVAWTNLGADGTTSHKAVAEGVIPCTGANGSFTSLAVTPSVQNWSNGEPNEGWVFVNDANDNGIDFRDSEFSTVAQRPQLSVTYLPAIAYSVGTNTADLKTGSPTIAITSGVATLSMAQAGPVGVGDVISYGAAPLVYIGTVISPTQFRVQLAAGGAPADTGAVAVNSIKRAFNSISSAVTQSLTPSYLGTGNLVTANRRLSWVCYKDGPLVESATIDGYTTDATRFITLTVAGASQVANGASQRHTGVAGSGTVVRPAAAAPHGISVRDQYTVVEWLEVDGTNVATPNADGLEVEFGNGQDALLRYLLVHDWRGGSGAGLFVGLDRATVRNSIVYGNNVGIQLNGFNSVFQNVTIYGSTGGSGFLNATSTGHSVENVISMGNSGDDFCCGNGITFNNNLSEDATATAYYVGSGNLTLRNPLDQFVSTTGFVDLHLKPGADAVNAGKSLAATFSDDIDAQSRPVAAAWDMGADEGGPLGAAGTMRILSGSYTGNGSAGRSIFVGFRPDIVIVDRNDPANIANNEAVIRTSTMAGDASKELDRNTALAAGKIQSLDISGFTIGSDTDVNQSGIAYHWVAFKAARGQLELGSYTGTGATWDMTRLSMQPVYVLTIPEGGRRPVTKSSSMPANFSTTYEALAYTDAILDLLPNGFRLGTNVEANESGARFHYAAWAAVPGRVAVGSYNGNNTAGTSIGPTGFLPEWVVVSRSNNLAGSQANNSVHKPAATGVSNDEALLFNSTLAVANNIQTLHANGFTVGSHQRVNSNIAPDNIYHWAAFGPHPTTTYYRSIGTAADLVDQGTITVTSGSNIVTKTGGAGWLVANRGRGDRLSVEGNHYVIAAVSSDNQLSLASAAVADYTGGTYTIARQFTTLQGWEDCISRSAANTCKRPADSQEYFPTATSSLVTDDRREVGIAYNDSAVPANPDFTARVLLQGFTTDASHDVTLTADGSNRHYGIPGAGVLVDCTGCPAGGADEIEIQAVANVTLEWLELVGFGTSQAIDAAIKVREAGSTNVLLRNLLIHGNGSGIRLSGTAGKDLTVRNSIIYDNLFNGIEADEAAGDVLTVENCTIYKNGGLGIEMALTPTANVIVRNTISMGNTGNDVDTGGGGPTVSYSVDSKGNLPGGCTGCLPSRTATDVPTASAGFVVFQNLTPGSENLHLRTSTVNDAVNTAVSLSASFTTDIDTQLRVGAWDMGADELDGTTAVKLASFSARGLDASVLVEWATASELDNIGFRLYRGGSPNGPWQRLNPSLIPGLGSSPLGKRYSWRDSGLENGILYYYRLEDVDASARTTSHGPVSAMPQGGNRARDRADDEGDGESGGKNKDRASASCPDWVLAAYESSASSSATSLRCTRHGEPEAVSLRVVSHDARQATLELQTGGFYALHVPAGGVRVFVPGFDFPQDPEGPALPFRRALVEAVVGRRVQLAGVRVLEQVAFRSLVPAALGAPEMEVSWDGTVRPGRRQPRALQARLVASELVRLLPSIFQGETKSAVVEIRPLRFDAGRDQLLLAKRVRLRLLFTGRDTSESGRGNHGRRRRPDPRRPVSEELLARLYTTSPGLYAAPFERLLAAGSRPVPVSELRLERLGEPVAFHVEPATESFGPGSTLFFFVDEAPASTDFSSELAFELVRAGGGVAMALVAAAPGASDVTTLSLGPRAFETNRFYQPGLLDAPDPWLWEAVPSGATRVVPFALTGVAASGSAELDVFLQGASESGRAIDHHLSVALNGTLLGEAQFAGKRPYRVSLSLPGALLREGTNELALTSVADTGVSSLVFLDRFQLAHPQASLLAGGRFEGSWTESGTATLLGASSVLAVLDVTPPDASGAFTPRWLTGYEASGGSLRMQVEAGRRYAVVDQAALLGPRLATPQPSGLRSAGNQADYLLVAPQAFLPAVQPLLERRADQGLAARAVAFEEIVAEFGHGQPSAEAIRDFLSHAFHSWAQPSPRYVLLVGDASYDPRNFIGSSPPAPLPALWTKTSYLLTASDAQLAAVNGEDPLPDLAIGRLPASSVAQAEALVGKLLAWEDSGQALAGRAALVADNPDIAGDFEADVRDIAQSYLAGRDTQLLLLSQLGAATRPRIQEALDSGLSYLGYVGHGGAAVWASENVWNSWDAHSLLAQSRQPLLITMNCLNGYYVAPSYDSLAESLLKAEGRGAIAAFSPSGLSLDGPAHQYHRALMDALTSGRHERLGDALLAAQRAYAETGLMPELLGVYHLFGDPATPIR